MHDDAATRRHPSASQAVGLKKSFGSFSFFFFFRNAWVAIYFWSFERKGRLDGNELVLLESISASSVTKTVSCEYAIQDFDALTLSCTAERPESARRVRADAKSLDTRAQQHVSAQPPYHALQERYSGR